jgi:hypothetical protein
MIEPREFWEVFAKNLRQKFQGRKSDFRDAYYSRGTEWTVHMTEFLSVLAGKFEPELHVDREYWPRIDVAYFSDCTPKDWSKWSLEVAIEHETKEDWHENELCKLMLVNAGLKVIIAHDDNPHDWMKNGFFEEFVEILKSRKYNNEAHWLFIVGPKNRWNGGDYCAFSSNNGAAVIEITDGRRILNDKAVSPTDTGL